MKTLKNKKTGQEVRVSEKEAKLLMTNKNWEEVKVGASQGDGDSKAEINSLKEDVKGLEGEVTDLGVKIEGLEAEKAELAVKVAELEAENTELTAKKK